MDIPVYALMVHEAVVAAVAAAAAAAVAMVVDAGGDVTPAATVMRCEGVPRATTSNKSAIDRLQRPCGHKASDEDVAMQPRPGASE